MADVRWIVLSMLAACASPETSSPVVVVPTATGGPPPIVSGPAPLPPPRATATTPPPVQRDPARAEQLFREAREAMSRGENERACRLFAESNALDPADGTLANLAMCE